MPSYWESSASLPSTSLAQIVGLSLQVTSFASRSSGCLSLLSSEFVVLRFSENHPLLTSIIGPPLSLRSPHGADDLILWHDPAHSTAQILGTDHVDESCAVFGMRRLVRV